MPKKQTPLTDLETTVNIVGDLADLPVRDDGEPGASLEPDATTDGETPETLEDDPETEPSVTLEPTTTEAARKHLRGLVEALVFAADQPIRPAEIGKLAHAPSRQIKEVLDELRAEYAGRGIQLEEIAGGFAFRTNVAYAPFVRDLLGQKPVKLTRAQLETLAIVAYRQPVTRPEIDDVRGVDCGPVLRTLLERDLVRILGKKEEAGRPILYGTSAGFLQLFGLKSLKDLPTLREFTELNEDSKRVVERELGESMQETLGGVAPEAVSASEHATPAPQPTEGDRPTLESAGTDHEPPPESQELEHDNEVPVSAGEPAEREESGEDDEDDEDWDDDEEDDEDWDDDDDEDDDEDDDDDE